MKLVVNSPKAPKAIGPYSQAVKANGFLFISGQLPTDPITGEILGSIKTQTRRSLQNLEAILTTAELSFADVVKTTVYLQDMKDFSDMNEIYSEYFINEAPARACVQVARLPKDALVEIELIAVCK